MSGGIFRLNQTGGLTLVDLNALKNKPDGIAGLDSSGLIPNSILPPAVVGALNYKGVWDCSVGSYPLTPSLGDYYICSVEGTIGAVDYHVSDWLVYNGSSWDKIDNNYGHEHDFRYYTIIELDAGQLDNRYYTETESDLLFGPDSTAMNDVYYTETELSSTSIGHTSGAHKIGFQSLPGATYNTIAEMFERISSTGRLFGGLITASDGTSVTHIDISEGSGLIKALDDDAAELVSFNWSASTNNLIPSESVRYIGIEYNSGTPQVVIKTSDTWDYDTEFPLGVVVRNEALHIVNNPWWVGDLPTNIIERFQALGRFSRDEFIGGLGLSVTGTRNISVSAGTLWCRVNEFPISALNTNVTGTFKTYWVDTGGNWTESDNTQYSVSQWNDPTQDTLQTITNNSFVNWWVYIMPEDDEIVLLYPQEEYDTSAEADLGTGPTQIPLAVEKTGVLMGRIIVEEGTDIPVNVQTIWDTAFNVTQASNHGNLSGLGDDDHTQYSLVDGSRAFTGEVEGVTPTADASLATKGYVDNNSSSSVIASDRSEPQGFVNITDSNISFDDSTLTFTIEPTGDSYDIYCQGTKYTKSTTLTSTITDTEGMWHFYFDENGDLQNSQTFNTNFIEIYAYIANLYWDASNIEHILLGEERHGINMSAKTHRYLHVTKGTQYQDGIGPTDIVADGNGSSNTHAQLGFGSGNIWDEDIPHSILVQTSPAQIPVFYKDGVAGNWRKSTPDDFPLLNTGTGRMAYNQFTGGAWQQTEVTNGDVALMHFFATNDSTAQIIVVQGENEYSNVSNGRVGAADEIQTIVTNGLPFVEFTPICTVIFQTSNSYSNDVKTRIRSTDTGDDFIDFRTTRGGGVAGSVNDHGSLSGLTDDDHSQYSLVDGSRAFSGTVSGVTPTASAHLATKEYVDSKIINNIGGRLILTNPGTVTVGTAGDYYRIDETNMDTGTWDGTTAINITTDEATGTFTIDETGYYHISVTTSFGGSISALVQIHTFVDGVQQVSGFDRKLGTGGDTGSASFIDFQYLTTGSEIDIRVTSDGNGDDVDFEHITFVVIRTA